MKTEGKRRPYKCFFFPSTLDLMTSCLINSRMSITSTNASLDFEFVRFLFSHRYGIFVAAAIIHCPWNDDVNSYFLWCVFRYAFHVYFFSVIFNHLVFSAFSLLPFTLFCYPLNFFWYYSTFPYTPLHILFSTLNFPFLLFSAPFFSLFVLYLYRSFHSSLLSYTILSKPFLNLVVFRYIFAIDFTLGLHDLPENLWLIFLYYFCVYLSFIVLSFYHNVLL